jgi:protein-tyrosine phosphatase
MADFSKIHERLYCGGQINDANDIQLIVAAGITHVINAQAERTLSDDLLGGLGYLWCPTADDGQHPKPVEWFRNAIDFALAAMSTQGRVLAQCGAGNNRGPSLAYAILRAQGLNASAAMTLLKAGRPQVGVAYWEDAELALKALGWI